MTISLHANFEVLKSYGEVEPMHFVREKTGGVMERDGADDTLYLPTSTGKRLCDRHWCADHGWNVVTRVNGVTSLEAIKDFVGKQKPYIAWPDYHLFWK